MEKVSGHADECYDLIGEEFLVVECHGDTSVVEFGIFEVDYIETLFNQLSVYHIVLFKSSALERPSGWLH